MSKNDEKAKSGASKPQIIDDGKLYLVRKKYNPVEVKNGQEVPLTYKDGTPFIRASYRLKMKLLGKSVEFTLACKDIAMKSVLEDFYGIADTDSLVLKVVKQTMTNSDTGETTTFNQLWVYLNEDDEIHKIQMECGKSDKSKFKMALDEYASKYVIPEEVIKYRKERYEAALQAKGLEEKNNNDIPF